MTFRYELYNELPAILLIFLEQNREHKRLVVDHGDWGYYVDSHFLIDSVAKSHDDEAGGLSTYILAYVLEPHLSKHSHRHEEWQAMLDDWDEFVKEWTAI